MALRGTVLGKKAVNWMVGHSEGGKTLPGAQVMECTSADLFTGVCVPTTTNSCPSTGSACGDGQ